MHYSAPRLVNIKLRHFYHKETDDNQCRFQIRVSTQFFSPRFSKTLSTLFFEFFENTRETFWSKQRSHVLRLINFQEEKPNEKIFHKQKLKTCVTDFTLKTNANTCGNSDSQKLTTSRIFTRFCNPKSPWPHSMSRINRRNRFSSWLIWMNRQRIDEFLFHWKLERL